MMKSLFAIAWLCASLTGALAVGLANPVPAAAACLRIGGTVPPDFGFAADVGASADLIVVARVVALEDERGTLKVLRVLKGQAGEQIDATVEALNDSCTRGAVRVGEKVVYVEGSTANEAPPDFAILRIRGGRWQHGFNTYDSLAALIARMGLMPDTATLAPAAGRGGELPLIATLLAGAALGLASIAFVRRLRDTGPGTG